MVAAVGMVSRIIQRVQDHNSLILPVQAVKKKNFQRSDMGRSLSAMFDFVLTIPFTKWGEIVPMCFLEEPPRRHLADCLHPSFSPPKTHVM